MIASTEVLITPTDQQPLDGEQQVQCALTGRTISAADAYWAPPLVTAGELASTVVRVLFSAPGMLGHVLFSEQPNVPYDPNVRDMLASRRSAEQLKLLIGLLVLATLIIIPIVLIAMR